MCEYHLFNESLVRYTDLLYFIQREPSPEQDVKIEIPEGLKKWLIDDWDFITRQKQVLVWHRTGYNRGNNPTVLS